MLPAVTPFPLAVTDQGRPALPDSAGTEDGFERILAGLDMQLPPASGTETPFLAGDGTTDPDPAMATAATDLPPAPMPGALPLHGPVAFTPALDDIHGSGAASAPPADPAAAETDARHGEPSAPLPPKPPVPPAAPLRSDDQPLPVVREMPAVSASAGGAEAAATHPTSAGDAVMLHPSPRPLPPDGPETGIAPGPSPLPANMTPADRPTVPPKAVPPHSEPSQTVLDDSPAPSTPGAPPLRMTAGYAPPHNPTEAQGVAHAPATDPDGASLPAADRPPVAPPVPPPLQFAEVMHPLRPTELGPRKVDSAPIPALQVQVAQAVTDLAAGAGDGRVTVQLQPEELGKLHFQMTRTAEGLHIHLTVDQPSTLDLLRRHSNELLVDLGQDGFAGTTLSFSSDSNRQDRAERPRDADPVEGPGPGPAAFIPPKLAPVHGGALNLRL